MDLFALDTTTDPAPSYDLETAYSVGLGPAFSFPTYTRSGSSSFEYLSCAYVIESLFHASS